MKIHTITPKINNSFGAIKIKPSLRKNIKSQTQILIENANKTINDKTADDTFEKASQKFYDYSREMKAKKDEIPERFFKHRAMYNAILEERDGKIEILKEKENGIKNLNNHLNKVTETVDTLRTQLAQLDSNTQIKSIRESDAIQDLKAKYMTNKGFSKLAGYEDEKNALYENFISEIENAKQGKAANVPNAVLFFGPKGTGKTTFAKALIQEIGAKCVSPHGVGNEKFLNKLITRANEAKELYEKTGQLSVIFLDEILAVASDESNILPELKDFMQDCYNKYHCIVFATTPDPLEVQLPITGKDTVFPCVVSVDPPNLENKQAVLKYYLSEELGNSVTDEDYKKLAEMLQQKEEETGNLYSNSKIEYCICRSDEYFNDKISLSDIVKNIKETEPDIRPNEMRKYNTELQKVFGIKITNVLERKIEELLGIKYEEANEQEKINELSAREEENETLVSALELEDLKADDLKDVMIGDTSLIDFWLDLENSELDKNRIKNNDRLKNIWFNETIKDENKVRELISITLDNLQNENELIKTARESYKDIIENDTTITDNQKEILVKQQESILFFKVISNNLNADDLLKMEVNILDTLEQLENEKTSIKENAINNIFTPVRNSSVLTSENAEDIENSEYIINLVKEAMLSNKFENKENLNIVLDKFSQAKLSGDSVLLEETWNEIVDIAQEYFETVVLDDITNRNIELLNSINEKVSDDDSKRIKDLTKDKTLSIEQREFIARHKDDKNFKILLNNQNINIKTIIEDLVFFESSNKALLEENNIDEETINIAQTMSDKFKQINNENKDIKIQTDRVLDKLGEIETSIYDFSENFNSFANDMLDIQTKEFQQIVMANEYLYSISNNTKDIKEYTQAITRAKLVELSKDKHYKDIIPEITNLLPNDEQFNLKDFMQQVETLAKQEKDTNKKKTIIKAGAIIAGTLAISAGTYYFGPQIVAHLASKLPVAQIGLTTNEVIKATNVAKKIGNSKLISFGRSINSIQHDINICESKIKRLKESIKKQPENTILGIDLEYAKKQLEKYKRELAKALKNTPKK